MSFVSTSERQKMFFFFFLTIISEKRSPRDRTFEVWNLWEIYSQLISIIQMNDKTLFIFYDIFFIFIIFRRGIDYLVYANVLENQSFWGFLANFWWPKLSKGTYTHRDLSYEPGKAHVSKPAVFGHFGWIRPFPVVKSGQNCQRHICTPRPFIWAYFKVLRPSITKKQPGKAHVT